MKNDILQFVSDILSNDKLTSVDKQRIIELAKKDVNNFTLNAESLNEKVHKVESKIDVIEEKIGLKTSDSDTTINLPPIPNNLPKYKDPKELNNFLLEYNTNSILKYTCHEVDDLESFLQNFDDNIFVFDKYLELINREYKILSSKYFGKINKNIQGLIWAYLNGNSPWSTDKINVSWGSEQLKLWCANYPTLVPHPGINLRRNFRYDGFEFDSISTKNTNSRIASFSGLVIHFKHLFHIRNDNSLKQFILRKNTLEKFDDDVEFEYNLPENIEFFSDIDKIIQAYDKIIEMILEFVFKNDKEKPQIVLSLYESNNGITLSIHHKNSTFGKTIKNCIERIGEKEASLICNQINGVCQMVLKANFGEENYAEINLWTNQQRKATPLKKFEGVEYQLIF